MNPRITVLAVDDNPMNIAVMEEILEEEYHLITATSGEEALDAARIHQPDLILLDIMMPGIDGYETCRRLRRDPGSRQLKIILVSAKAMTSERLAGYDVGADDYITKPFDKNELLAKVRVFLRLKSAEDLDRIKTAWMEQMDYEIRTPLTGIIPAGELLLADAEMTKVERQMWGAIIMECATRMVGTAEKCRLLCQFKSGTTDLERLEVDFVGIVTDIAEELKPTATEKNVTVEVIADGAQPVRGDPRYLRLVVQYLLENAIQYGEEGSAIQVTLKSLGENTSITFVNRAAPANDDTLRAITSSVGSDLDNSRPGSRLSLPLAREIVKTHHGTFDASVEGDRVSVSCSLPIGTPAHATVD